MNARTGGTAIQETVSKAIREVAPRVEVGFRDVDGRVSATAIAPEFEDVLHLDRQRKVWANVRRDLGADATRVGMLLLYLPVEAHAIGDEDEQSVGWYGGHLRMARAAPCEGSVDWHGAPWPNHDFDPCYPTRTKSEVRSRPPAAHYEGA